MATAIKEKKATDRSSNFKRRQRNSSFGKKVVLPQKKTNYIILNHGGNICLYSVLTKKTEPFTRQSAAKIPPGAKITIKQDGMSRVQVASIIDVIYGSKATG